ncbi:MAG TPA: hypothetical protein VFX16_31610 [Pseudonocardiaceae bacterium]|nr:hypothetical protein [Pseudonocardiaceae bacterium]
MVAASSKNLHRATVGVVVLAVLMIGLAVVIREATGSTAPHGGPAPSGSTVQAPIGATSATPAAPLCGTVLPTDSTGAPVPAPVLDEVVAVHAAACRHDFSALTSELDGTFDGGRSSGAVMSELRDRNGAELVILAQTLETSAQADQGGWVYCHPHGAVAIFSRGTTTHPATWSLFSVTGDNPGTYCVH